jgi:hypothetical protein
MWDYVELAIISRDSSENVIILLLVIKSIVHGKKLKKKGQTDLKTMSE